MTEYVHLVGSTFHLSQYSEISESRLEKKYLCIENMNTSVQASSQPAAQRLFRRMSPVFNGLRP
jgi:hypothetical protein